MWIFRNPEASCAMPDYLLIKHRRMQISMAQKAESEEGICHPFGEENSAYTGRDVRECKSDTANNEILEKCGMLGERRL